MIRTRIFLSVGQAFAHQRPAQDADSSENLGGGEMLSQKQNAAPDIIRAFQKDYPNIDYELLLGDYTELEEWVKSGRVDCTFLRLPTCAGASQAVKRFLEYLSAR